MLLVDEKAYSSCINVFTFFELRYCPLLSESFEDKVAIGKIYKWKLCENCI